MRFHRLPAALALLAACSGGGSGGPASPPGPDRTIASITISAPSGQMEVGATLQLTASAHNAAGEPLSGVDFAWQSSDPSIASVDAGGRVTGRGPGSVSIQASAGGRTGSADLAVQATISITSVTPSPIVEGANATITGTGFAATPAGNRVTIGGVDATVVSATATALQVTVPADCQPPGRTAVRVTVGARSSPTFDHPLESTVAPLDLPVGTVSSLTPAAGGCLQFPSGSSGEFLVGVQSISEVVSAVTPLRIRALSGIPVLGDLAPSGDGGGRGLRPSGELDLLLDRHRRAELRIRQEELALLRSGRVSLDSARGLIGRRDLRPAAAVKVGDRFDVRIPDRERFNTCTDFVTVTVEVRHVGERGIFVEDIENPEGGFSDAQYAELSAALDGPTHETITGHFGTTTDLDGNGRVVIVLSRRLNGWLEATNSLGFVSFVNLVERSECPTSNEGELYYSLAPDPLGIAGPAISTTLMLQLETVLLPHEVTHLIQYAGRIETPGATSLMPPWQAEGQATYAEEIVGFRTRNREPGRNFGPDVLFEDADLNWHQGIFFDLVSYFGFESPELRVSGAPEQCSFLGLPSEGNSGPCIGRMAYGVSWSFFRWLSDQVGPAAAPALHQRIIRHTGSGFDTIEDATGSEMGDLLALWAASLYVDDRYSGMDPSLLWTSWNLFAIDQGVVQTARLVPRTAGGSVADLQVSVRAGSSAYYLIHGTAASLRVRGASSSALPPNIRIWAVRVR